MQTIRRPSLHHHRDDRVDAHSQTDRQEEENKDQFGFLSLPLQGTNEG